MARWTGRDSPHLIDEVLAVIVAELLRADDAVEICLHKLLDEVDLAELVDVGRLEDVEDGDDVFVMEVAKELYLAECSETEHGVIKWRDALDCDLALGGYMDS